MDPTGLCLGFQNLQKVSLDSYESGFQGIFEGVPEFETAKLFRGYFYLINFNEPCCK